MSGQSILPINTPPMVWRVRKWFSLAAILTSQAALGGCATSEQHALGKILRGGDVPVYKSDITAKYTVIKELSETRQQICGPNYYDDFAGAAWMAGAAAAVGANAVINYRSTSTGMSLLSCGTFQVMATAVKIVK
jgi:hypothetical protein